MKLAPHHIEQYRLLQQELNGMLIDFSVAEKELRDLLVMLNAVSKHYKNNGPIDGPTNTV